ncbi:alpha/beta fold hydrolase [Nonomuraea terrae]|uniref:Alpha/beta fold hydrolase n=1 Tax=Nonomuraea terrae TaxID=2530383 RepID=A0A4R4YUL3_9ACTN|nr:alpha/beta hydrolase [Nonomuraea terrae]TDD49061.1 alpha/beta fold hydrolase [Nonomuraea terrae]
MDSGVLDVPGARLYFEVRGSGPALLTVIGGGSDAAMAAPLAEALSARYTVITYDRRGATRSPLTGPPAQQRIDEHAGDALRLLDATGPDPAYVFATHSGAMIALDLLARHPGRVRRLVAHEPPVFGLLPDGARWRRLAEELLDLHAREGIGPALRKLGEETGVPPPPEPDPGLPSWVRAMLTRMAANLETSVLYELRPFSAFVPDAAALRAAPVVLAYGAHTRGRPLHRTTLAVAELLGTTAVELPGDHVGYLRSPAEFAQALHDLLTP